VPVDLLSVILRALSFLALFQAAGITLFLALHQQAPNTERALRRIGTVVAPGAAMLLIAQYLLEAARMSGELSGVLDPALQGVVMRSAVSASLACRLLGLLLIALALQQARTGGHPVGLTGVVLLLASFTLVGHTSQHALRWLLSPLLLVHVAVITFWYGALLPLYLVSSREPPETAAAIVQQFSARAVFLAPLLLLTGLAMAAVLLPDLAALHRPYGELLIAKVIAFCALMPLAALNRWRLGPAVRCGGRPAGRRFRQVLAAEFALLATVLCITAVMTTFYSPDG
jgi:copper resistance protein D